MGGDVGNHRRTVGLPGGVADQNGSHVLCNSDKTARDSVEIRFLNRLDKSSLGMGLGVCGAVSKV